MVLSLVFGDIHRDAELGVVRVDEQTKILRIAFESAKKGTIAPSTNPALMKIRFLMTIRMYLRRLPF